MKDRLSPWATLVVLTGLACHPASGQSPSVLPTAEAHVLTSDVLGEEREILISLPPSYASGTARYPVVYILDGPSNLAHTAASARHLAAHSRMPDAILVAIANRRREFDMTPSDLPLPTLGGQGGRADAFLAFLRDELGAWVDQRYRTSTLRVLLGHSHGGLFAGHVFATDPDAFAAYVLMDAPMSLGDGAVALHMIESVRGAGPARIVSVERGFGFRESDWTTLASAAGPSVRLTRLDHAERGETHSSMVLPATYEGLAAVFADFPKLSVEPRTATRLAEEFRSASASYGHEIQPTLSLLVSNAEAQLMLRQGRLATELIETATDLYGPSPRLDRLRAQAAEAGHGDGLVSVALEEGAAASARDLAPYFGTWEGRMHHEGGIPEYFLITFFANGDEVAATFAGSRPGRREYGDPIPLEFVRQREGMIEFGSKNQRMPGGTWVYSVRPNGTDDMIGTKELKGVMLPVGIVLPTMHITLRRRETGGIQ